MGVEYRHYLIPEKASFVPTSGVIKRMDAVLDKWKLKSGTPEIYNLTANNQSVVEAPLHTLIFGQGFGIQYPWIEDPSVIAPCHYRGDPNNDGHISSLIFVVGLDYRIHSSDDYFKVSVLKPPYEGDTPLKPYWEQDPLLFTHEEAYHSTIATTAPEVEAIPYFFNRVVEPNFKGYWRTALVFDFGRSIPEMPEEGRYKIPNNEFIKDVEEALGCQVIETGGHC